MPGSSGYVRASASGAIRSAFRDHVLASCPDSNGRPMSSGNATHERKAAADVNTPPAPAAHLRPFCRQSDRDGKRRDGTLLILIDTRGTIGKAPRAAAAGDSERVSV